MPIFRTLFREDTASYELKIKLVRHIYEHRSINFQLKNLQRPFGFTPRFSILQVEDQNLDLKKIQTVPFQKLILRLFLSTKNEIKTIDHLELLYKCVLSVCFTDIENNYHFNFSPKDVSRLMDEVNEKVLELKEKANDQHSAHNGKIKNVSPREASQ
eukprot:Awhi_evm2s1278